MPKLRFQGFNHLTKTLSCNLYDIHYVATPSQRERYLAYVDETYNAERLTRALRQVAETIGAKILNIAHQAYQPRGASVTVLIAEQTAAERPADAERSGPWPETVLCHLDKSHLAVHTYPESHPDGGVNTLRVDIDLSTCGRVSPLQALDELMRGFKTDLAVIDYRVRGFTRDATGRKRFSDQPIRSIRDFLPQELLQRYRTMDRNLRQERIFHTKLMREAFDPNDQVFDAGPRARTPGELAEIERRVRREMVEIFHGGQPREDAPT